MPIGILGVGRNDRTDIRAGDRCTGNYTQRIAPTQSHAVTIVAALSLPCPYPTTRPPEMPRGRISAWFRGD